MVFDWVLSGFKLYTLNSESNIGANYHDCGQTLF